MAKITTTIDRELLVDSGGVRVTIRFSSEEEIKRAKCALLLLATSTMQLRGKGSALWDSMTPELRAQIESDADWLNDKITAAKLGAKY